MSFAILKITTESNFADLLKADLAEIGFDSFLEEGDTFETSIEESQFDKAQVEEIINRYSEFIPIDYSIKTVEKENWNQLWEQNYLPIIINDNFLIRADFHEIAEKYEHEIIITPKMSFGTGHHETTTMLIEYLLEHAPKGKKIADFGCGTGILAIAALKLGASSAIACDIEDWSVENTLENAATNGVTIEVFVGTAEQLVQQEVYDIVLANINLNVLMEEMHLYSKLLKPEGILLMSGFYEKNARPLTNKAAQHLLSPIDKKVRDEWCALRFYKKQVDKQ